MPITQATRMPVTGERANKTDKPQSEPCERISVLIPEHYVLIMNTFLVNRLQEQEVVGNLIPCRLPLERR